MLIYFQDLTSIYGYEQWLVLYGPFPTSSVLDFISRFCPPKSVASDQGLCSTQVSLGLKIIIVVSSEGQLTTNLLER